MLLVSLITPTVVVHNGNSSHTGVTNSSSAICIFQNHVKIDVGLVLIVVDDGDGDGFLVLVLSEHLEVVGIWTFTKWTFVCFFFF